MELSERADGVTLLGGVSVVTFMEEATAFQKLVQNVEQRGRQMLRRIGKADCSFPFIVARGKKSAECKELTRLILGEISASVKRPVSIGGEAMNRLKQHDWPGNIRELRNVLEFATYLSQTASNGKGICKKSWVDTIPFGFGQFHENYRCKLNRMLKN